MPIFVKICGLAREADVRSTAELLPDALGFVFWPRSPRAVSASQVAAWTRDLPPGLLKVGVFVNQPVSEVRDIVERAGLDIAQLHGEEDGAYLRALDLPAWKAVHLDRFTGVSDPAPRALLVDSGTVDMPGGTGKRVDTERARAFVAAQNLPVLLAGGLKAATVRAAVETVRPWGVDVSSGVERVPGEKNPDQVRAFLLEARAANPS